jgi:hypothetical protein
MMILPSGILNNYCLASQDARRLAKRLAPMNLSKNRSACSPGEIGKGLLIKPIALRCRPGKRLSSGNLHNNQDQQIFLLTNFPHLFTDL